MSDADQVSSLTVLGGRLNGTRLLLDPSVDEILIGSDPDCGFALDAPGVSPIHARLWLDFEGAKVYDTRSPSGVFVNDTRVAGEAKLRDGDVLWLGAPGAPDSLMIQCRFLPAPLPGPAPSAGEMALGDPIAMEDSAGFFVDEPPAAAAPAADAFLFIEDPAPPPAPAPAVGAPNAPEEQAMEEFLFDEPEPEPAPRAVPAPPSAPKPVIPPALAPRPPAAAAAKPALPVAPKPAVPEAPAAAKPSPTPVTPVASAPKSAPPATPVPVQAVPPAALKTTAPAASKLAPPAPKATPAAPPLPRPAGAAAPPTPAPPGRARVSAAGPSPIARFGPIALGAVLLLAAGGYAAMRFLSAPSLEAVTPGRVRMGDAVTLTGKNFARSLDGNVVMFNDQAGHVIEASSTRLKVEVPGVTMIPGRDADVAVVVRAQSRESKPLPLAVFQAPRLHGVSPDVGMPGDEIVVAGAGWGTTVQVKFGAAPGEVVSTSAASIMVRVPALEAVPGTSFPITVSVGADPSNPAPFMLGRLPLIRGIEPPSANPGDVVTLAGRGFAGDAARDDVRIGGVKALVTKASEGELRVVVPFGASGETSVEVRVPGSENLGQSSLSVGAPSDPLGFHFSAEPVEGASPAERAIVSTALGPAFVLAAAGGKSAALRAEEAVRRLNAAAGPLKASREADIVARGLEDTPVLGLAGGNETLLEVTAEDAQGYYERQGGRGAIVVPARLALWWEAIARDLVVLLVRGEKPARAAALAPEGRVLGDVFEAARKTGSFGVARSVVVTARPGTLAAIRSLALRVPASVPAPAGSATAASKAGVPALRLEQNWSGFESADGVKKYLTVVFRGRSGTFAYDGGVSVTLPLWSVEAQKNSVSFGVEAGGRRRHYVAQWDGSRLAGTISTQEGGKGDLGNFELTPR